MSRHKKSNRPAWLAMGLLAGAVVLLTSGCAAWRLSKTAELVKQSEALQQSPADPAVRLLVVGDSTAVGTGASSPQTSLAGLLAQGRPRLLIENRAHDGATFADVVGQLHDTENTGGSQRFDIVLVQAGGNDVIRLRGMAAVQADVQTVAERAARLGRRVLLMPAGNVGNAPFFFAPLSWLMTQRSRDLHRFVADAAAKTGATYVKLFHERSDDPFALDVSLNASDGLHPSDSGYRIWFRELMQQAHLDRQLAPAEAPDRTVGAGLHTLARLPD